MSPDASTQNSTLAGHLLDQYAGRIARSRRPYLLGLSGLQGSGKSTLAREMKAQAEARGWPTEVLSLDDFYYSRSERDVLAHQIHPLLRTRGVPGTHEIELLLSVLAALPQASDKLPVSYPRFDKGRDTRVPPSRWPHVTRPHQFRPAGPLRPGSAAPRCPRRRSAGSRARCSDTSSGCGPGP